MCVRVRRVNSSRNDNDGLFRPCSRTSLALCVCVCLWPKSGGWLLEWLLSWHHLWPLAVP